MRFGFIGPDYTPESILADSQLLMNMIYENIESQKGKSAAFLYNSPGLSLITSLANGGGRGIISAQSRDFVVCGTQFWELTGSFANFLPVNRGAVVSDGQPVCMASSKTQVMFVSAGNLYLFDLLTNTLSTIGTSDGTNGLLGTPQRVRYLLGSFYCLQEDANGNSLIQQSSLLDGSTWPAVAETGVSVFSDNVLEIFEDHLLLWVFGPKQIVPYEDVGSFPFALTPYETGIMEQGLAATNSVCRADNSIFWLGADERGRGIIWRANGFTPQRVSNFALEAEIATYSTISDCVSYPYQENGHTFVVFRFPTADKTKVYDCSNGTWSRRSFMNVANGNLGQSRAGFHTYSQQFQAHIVLDPINGNVYQQSIQFLDDAGTPIKRIRRATHICAEMEYQHHKRLQLDAEVGIGPNFPGQAAPTLIPFLDLSGAIRTLAVTEQGILQANLTPNPVAAVQTIFINDSLGTTSWQITCDAFGKLDAVQQPTYYSGYLQAIPFVSVLGGHRFTLQLQVAGGKPILNVIPLSQVLRGPNVVLRFSDDGAQSFSNPYTQSCGEIGNYRKRLLWNRLGRARDRVYEISATDPASYRWIEAYLITAEDRQPSARVAAEIAKRA